MPGMGKNTESENSCWACKPTKHKDCHAWHENERNVIQEKNERIVQISFCLRNPHLHLEKKIIKNILSDKVYAPYKVLYAMIDVQLIVFICELLTCTFLIR